jgi:hypothetical protein
MTQWSGKELPATPARLLRKRQGVHSRAHHPALLRCVSAHIQAASHICRPTDQPVKVL